MALMEYKPGSPYSGVIGRTADVSRPAWPQPVRAKKEAPNVMVIVCWSKGIADRGELRKQYTHIIDMVPTVLEALGIEAPERIRGVRNQPSKERVWPTPSIILTRKTGISPSISK